MKSREAAVTDNLGNAIILLIYTNTDEIDVSATVYLKLKSEDTKRNIGTIHFHDDSFHVNRDSSKHYHYVSKSYGFNWYVLNHSELNIKKVHLIIDKTTKYVIPIDIMKKYSKVLNFKQQGFELQRFLPMTMIKEFKDEKFNPTEQLKSV